jgi:dTDP-4-amino-4,6-dideoxygalactose transaminase
MSQNTSFQNIPLLNLQEQYQAIGADIEAAVLDVLRSCHFILGKYGSELEQKVAELSGCKYGIGVANGTDALVLSVWALDLEKDDEVITTPFTFAATVEAILIRGAKPVFVDVFEDSFNINTNLIEAAITPKTKAIMPIHLYGQPANMEAIMAIAKKHGLKVIEDNAQGIGATINGKPTGTFGDLACTSFYPTKNLGAAGDAGMITTNDKALYERLKSIRAHGMTRRYYHDELGVNSRLDEIQAAVLMTKLPHLKGWIEKRQSVARLYKAALSHCPGVIAPKLSFGTADANETTISHVWHQYTIRITAQVDGRYATARDTVCAELAKRGIGSMCYYPVPLHVQTAFAHLGYKQGQFPISEKLSDQVISLPIYPELKAEQVAYIAQSLQAVMAENFGLSVPGAAPVVTTAALSV